MNAYVGASHTTADPSFRVFGFVDRDEAGIRDLFEERMWKFFEAVVQDVRLDDRWLIDRRPSATTAGGSRRIEEQIHQALAAAKDKNWNGYGAMPASLESARQAKKFAKELPVNIPEPRIAVDPDGEISFDWSSGPNRVLSISLGPEGRLGYAGIIGNQRVHGSRQFVGEIPQQIEKLLAKLTADSGSESWTPRS